MTDLDTALRAADFHVPEAAKVIREHLEAQKAELLRWERSFAGHVYVPDDEYVALVEKSKGAEQAERERDALLALLRDSDTASFCAEGVGLGYWAEMIGDNELAGAIEAALTGAKND